MATALDPVDQRREDEVWSQVHPGVERWTTSCPQKDEHETEDTFETNSDVTSRKDCIKHPKHSEFVSIPDFGVDKVGTVPPHKTAEEIVEYVLVWAALVVKIVGSFVSLERPAMNYPFSSRRGQSCELFGSGWIRDVSRPIEVPCLCVHCCNNPARKSVCWEICIQTARHVVFNDEEAKKCEVILFDDHHDKTGTYKLTGYTVKLDNHEEDRGVLFCYTCDEDLVNRLRKFINQRIAMMEKREKTKNAHEKVEGLDSSVRERMIKLGKRYHEIEDKHVQRMTELRCLNLEFETLIKKKLDEFWVRIQEGEITIDSVARQALESLSDRQGETGSRHVESIKTGRETRWNR